MTYEHIAQATFLSRPNRFLAICALDGQETLCHVKNTGRCRELLIPGTQVILARGETPGRRTAFDLVSVWKGERLINLDSQAPNRVAAELLPRLFPGAEIRPEVRFGDSRLDFLLTEQGRKRFLEVKGVTLEEHGVALFPDAPTERGVRHLRELLRAKAEGHDATLLFLIQMQGVEYLIPNETTHPAFGEALRAAAEGGVEILAYDCEVTPRSLTPRLPVPVRLSP